MSAPSSLSVAEGAADPVPGSEAPGPNAKLDDGQRYAAEPLAGRFSLLTWFLLLSFVSVTAVSIASAYLLQRFVTERMLALDVSLTTEFVNNIFGSENADRYFSNPDERDKAELGEFFTHVGRMPGILRANIYLRDGTVLWSTDTDIIGRRFTDNNELRMAASGNPLYALGVTGTEDKDEHVDLGEPGRQFVENYIPMFRNGRVGGEVLGVLEIYRTPKAVLDTIRAGRLLIFASALIGVLLIIGALYWLIQRADAVMRRQEHAIATNERLATAGEMASAVAHGLRNPLASIRSSAELAMRLRSPERVHALLDDIVVQSDRLEYWVRQYLSAVEPDSADRAADLAKVLGTVRGSFATDLSRYGITWRETPALDLPPVRMGSALLEQVLSGLVTNAIQAMPEGGEISVTMRRAGDGLIELQLTDTGHGMSAEQLSRAFVPFATSKQTGLGLGLPLARRILERHGASIALQSRPGGGHLRGPAPPRGELRRGLWPMAS